MKTSKIILGLSALIILTTSAAYAQKQTLTHTVTAQSCNTGCSLINAPGLNDNPSAIMLATKITTNTHPIGAYYRAYEKKWSIFNLDGTSIAVGAKFDVEYYANPGPNEFVYVAPYGANACIDHPGLNDKPNALVRVFPTQSPTLGGYFNKNEVKVEYSTAAKKWCVSNVVSGIVFPGGTAYNVVISPLTPAPAMNTATFVPLPTPTPSQPARQGTPFVPPVTLAPPANSIPSGTAGGDLSGTFPNPKVIGLQGNPVSDTAPDPGQVLKWNGTVWKPAGPAGKLSVLSFDQTYMSFLTDYDTQNIAGLDNQAFTLAQNSRIVFQTIVVGKTLPNFLVTPGDTSVWLTVEILNSSNAVVAFATSESSFGRDFMRSISSIGVGILPAGIYHTRVSIKRVAGGSFVYVFKEDEVYQSIESRDPPHPHQGGRLIIKIFPD